MLMFINLLVFCEYFIRVRVSRPIVIPSVSVGIQPQAHSLRLILAVTSFPQNDIWKIQIFRSTAHEVRFTKQIILRNCGLIVYPSYFDSKDSLRGSCAINRARLSAIRKNACCRCLCDDFCAISRTLACISLCQRHCPTLDYGCCGSSWSKIMS